jgi:tRNA (uracil-5-)-methyltransferase
MCEALFAEKVDAALARLADFSPPTPDRYHSAASGYRLRAEFRVWHDGDDLNYVMFPPGEPRNPQIVEAFPIASPRITGTMAPLLTILKGSTALRRKLFQVEFLSTLSGELLITLIYHRPIEDEWLQLASLIAEEFSCKIIGRSRKQKRVLDTDWVEEVIEVDKRQYRYRQPEQCFTQPNGGINQHMMQWLLRESQPVDSDLLELYCGIGNFTLPLSQRFRSVLATELSKPATEAARWNVQTNQVGNIELARLSAEEMTAAMAKERPFRRLAHLKQPLDDYQFDTLLVDPPRAGLDAATLKLASTCQRVLYISCNPETLSQNLATLSGTHAVQSLAFFDQFPYTPHLESGVILTRQ